MKAKDKIIQAFFTAKKRQLYFNELKELTALSNSSLQNTLRQLIHSKYIHLYKTKAHTFYKIENNLQFALEFAKISLIKFQQLNRGIRIPLKHFLEKYPQNTDIIVLFGSASKNQETKQSDIDILIVTDNNTNFELIKKEVNAVSNYPLSVFCCNYNEFVMGEDHVIIQAKQTGFPIKAHQQFYEVIVHEFR